MCIALPVEIVEVIDAAQRTVLVRGHDGDEEVSAALLDDVAPGDLLGRWAVVHAGFILSLMDAEDARSRLAVFAAMRGEFVADQDLRPTDAAL